LLPTETRFKEQILGKVCVKTDADTVKSSEKVSKCKIESENEKMENL
jgi:hypothetical protein